MFKWVDKKDLVYWLIFVMLISFLSSDIGQFERLVLDNWAFAGTVVSIILAVIAILYTFDQSSTTVASTKKLEESAKRVEIATKGLENNNVDTLITDLENRLTDLLKEMHQGIDENINTKFAPLKDLEYFRNSQPFLDKNLQILSDEGWRRYLNNNIVIGLNLEGLTLLYSYFLYENDLDYSIEKTEGWILEITREENRVKEYLGLINGQMRLFSSFNVFDYKQIDEQARVSEFISYNEVVFEEIKSIVANNMDQIGYIIRDLKDIFDIEE
ncbi:hypothetical protein [Solibacillus sp. FSL K6-1523]|uniref:hypothetical protein n=1 Tax=Solibacillus sp. FSL K6-1523 TaxID=2921471 RepID=UPI0030FC889F